MYDLVYFYPEQSVNINNCVYEGIERYLPNIIGPLNKLKDFGLNIKSIALEFEGDLRQKVIDTESTHYLIDMQDPLSLGEAEKLVRYCSYYHKTAKIYVVGRFALKLHELDLLPEISNIDFIFSSCCEEVLCFAVNKNMLNEIKTWRDSDYKLQLSTYNHIQLNTFANKTKVKRAINPRYLVLVKEKDYVDNCQLDIVEIATAIDDHIEEGIKKVVIKRSDLQQGLDFDTIDYKAIDLEYKTDLFEYDKDDEIDFIEVLLTKFKKVFVTVIGINDDIINFINSLKDNSNIKFKVVNAEYFVDPTSKTATGINTSELEASIKALKLGKKVEVVNENILTDQETWELTDEVVQKLRKRF